MTESLEVITQNNIKVRRPLNLRVNNDNDDAGPFNNKYILMTSKGIIRINADKYNDLQERLQVEYAMMNKYNLECKLKSLYDNRTHDFFGIIGSIAVAAAGAGAIVSQSVEGWTGAIAATAAFSLGTYGAIKLTKEFVKTYSDEYKKTIFETQVALSKAKNRSFYC